MGLPDLLPAVRRLSVPDKIRLLRILAEELEPHEDISPFEPSRVYFIGTPCQTEGAAKALSEAGKTDAMGE